MCGKGTTCRTGQVTVSEKLVLCGKDMMWENDAVCEEGIAYCAYCAVIEEEEGVKPEKLPQGRRNVSLPPPHPPWVNIIVLSHI